jgi:hypothetical protein
VVERKIVGDTVERQADRIGQGCMWMMVGFVILLAVFVCICIVAFAIYINT